MIVREINIEYITIFDSKSDAPIAANRYGPNSFHPAFQAMQPISREVQVARTGRGMEDCEDVLEALSH
jgi:hypothetical protein